jgi:hypothetical protein
MATPQSALKFKVEVTPTGRVEIAVPFPPGSKVEVLVFHPAGDEAADLTAAATSSLGFWDNPEDDEDWNNA